MSRLLGEALAEPAPVGRLGEDESPGKRGITQSFPGQGVPVKTDWLQIAAPPAGYQRMSRRGSGAFFVLRCSSQNCRALATTASKCTRKAIFMAIDVGFPNV